MSFDQEACFQNLSLVFRRYRGSGDSFVINNILSEDETDKSEIFFDDQFLQKSDCLKERLPKILKTLCDDDWSGPSSAWEKLFRYLVLFRFYDWSIEERDAVLSAIHLWMIDLDESGDHDTYGVISDAAFNTGFDQVLFGADDEEGPTWKITFQLKRSKLYILLRNLVPMKLKQSEILINESTIRVLKWHDLSDLKQFFESIGSDFLWMYSFTELNLSSLRLKNCETHVSGGKKQIEFSISLPRHEDLQISTAVLESSAEALCASLELDGYEVLHN